MKNKCKVLCNFSLCLVLLCSSLFISGISKLNVKAAETAPTIKFIYVGEGASSIIKYNGKYILVDCGKYGETSKIIEVMQNEHIEEFEYVILTHYDSDHIGGLLTILKTKFKYDPTITDAEPDNEYKVKVNHFISRKYSSDTLKRLREKTPVVFQNYIKVVNAVSMSMGCYDTKENPCKLPMKEKAEYTDKDDDDPYTEPEVSEVIKVIETLNKKSDYNWVTANREANYNTITISGTGTNYLEFNFLNRQYTFFTEANVNTSPVYSSDTNVSNLVNDDSLVFRLSYRDSSKEISSILYTGDIYYHGLKELISSQGSKLCSNTLVVPHHGILVSTTANDKVLNNFIGKVSASRAVIQYCTNPSTTNESRINAVIKKLKNAKVTTINQVKNYAVKGFFWYSMN